MAAVRAAVYGDGGDGHGDVGGCNQRLSKVDVYELETTV
jgi:hypothetical protein